MGAPSDVNLEDLATKVPDEAKPEVKEETPVEKNPITEPPKVD
jgi:hypothetical protein